ncbi:MAG TPA: glycoside hydrolase family 3 N-terminal domain-containing protein [Tenuifilaceae bacterium]|nr:glycoside hydrolase family 3 N-terminal domain-containing protein [Tenuifilaceae bacterium]HPQ33109.1 glycoside hydrolase family 3 N-terminal domain-containing protein [Tenuifilaceae bacterium]
MFSKKLHKKTRVQSIILILLFSLCNTLLTFGDDISGTPEAQQWVDSVLNSLSLRERIAQLFMVAAYSNGDENHVEELTELILEENIGGLCFFQGGPVRQVQQTNYYQSIAKTPLLISMDAEWGLGMRLDSTISYPRQMMLGAAADSRLAYQMGADIAKQLKRIGVHLNFAPVVDVNSNPDNPVINTRAFGEERELVAQKGLAYMLGLQDNGILACAKHFPGHGDTNTDSHYDLPVITHNSNRLDSVELHPFKRLIQHDVSSVMVAHIEVPNLEPTTKLASSLSYRIVDSLLTKTLGFNGLVITDALNMKGVSNYYEPKDLNYLALQAGNDILLFPSDVKKSISKIEKEVKKGHFPKEEIDRRCRKILEAKYRVGLNRFYPINNKDLISDLNSPAYKLLIRQITEQAVTVLKNDRVIPIGRLDSLSIAYLEIGNGMGQTFFNQLEMYAPVSYFSLDENQPSDSLNSQLSQLIDFNTIIIGYHNLSSYSARNFGVSNIAVEAISTLSKTKNCIVTLFGSPYALSKIDDIESVNGLIAAYDNSETTQSLTAQLIFGGFEKTSGKLPVTINSHFKRGNGIDAGEKIRLKYSIPEELNISSCFLQKIDSIALDAINNEATPGMQILAAKNGIVFYNKNFGNYTYTNAELAVTGNSLYDIASLTKISATLPEVMDLFSKKQIDITEKLGNYMYLPDTSEYKNIIISDILLHQAGLKPWIPFYINTISSLIPNQPITSKNHSSTYAYQLSPNWYLSKNTEPSDNYYKKNYSFNFPVEVASNIFAVEGITDTIFSWILRSPINNIGKYTYSDLGFILLHRGIGNIIRESHIEYLYKNFYHNLGMNRTCFNPLKKFDILDIVPTENDLLFRKQLIWGHVHDPAAAMMGGIAGHAGLFSTANDLAKLFQMFLNKGTYGGVVFIPDSTLELFTSCVNCHNGTRRGLGFDKPEPNPEKPSPVSRSASALSYGHSGFTGVLAWVDPEYDLVYIFLSNRIYPDANNSKLVDLNIRTNIQDIIYQAIRQSEEDYGQ